MIDAWLRANCTSGSLPHTLVRLRDPPKCRDRRHFAGAARINDNASHRVGCFRNIRLGTIKPTQIGFTARGEGPD
jgi:hypothetical protein